MSIANHAAVGAGLALVFRQPALALPFAFLSHFVLDALPHFGYPGGGFDQAFRHKRMMTFVETFNVIAIVALIIVIRDQNWLVFVAAIVAMSPDFVWVYRYYFLEKKGLSKPGEGTWFDRFHSKIQWCERPWGIVVEIVFFIAVFVFITRKVACR